MTEKNKRSSADFLASPVTFGTLTRDGTLSNVRVISKSSISACPHCIFMPEHYREDGTCKCDDESEKVMREWGYKWNKKQGRWL